MYSSLKVFKNPKTGELVSLFIHNIRTIIVTDEITVHCDDAGQGYKTLEQLGFTEQLPNQARITV